MGIDLTGMTQTTLTSFDASGLTATGPFGGVTLTTGALAASSSIKGSASGTNIITFSAAATASTFVTYTGGTGQDIITASNGRNNVIDLGGGTSINSVVGTTGNQTITSTSTGTDTVTLGAGNNIVNLGNGVNNFTATSGNNTYTGGTGVDTVSVGGGVNSITLGAGADVVTLTAATVSATLFSTITDAQVGDTIRFTTVNGTPTFLSTAKITLGSNASFTDYLVAGITSSQAAQNTNSNMSWFQFNGNTYIVQDNSVANSATFANGVDSVVMLTGLVTVNGFTGAAGSATFLLA
jgi:S-layer protein